MEGTQEKKPVYYPSESSWVIEADGLHLLGNRCRSCEQSYFPQREVCPKCYAEGIETRMEKIKLSSQGKLYSYSTVQVAPKRFQPPYTLGYVDLPEGVRVLAQIIIQSPDQLKVDSQVRAELGKVAVDEKGNEVMSYKFRPV